VAWFLGIVGIRMAGRARANNRSVGIKILARIFMSIRTTGR